MYIFTNMLQSTQPYKFYMNKWIQTQRKLNICYKPTTAFFAKLMQITILTNHARMKCVHDLSNTVDGLALGDTFDVRNFFPLYLTKPNPHSNPTKP